VRSLTLYLTALSLLGGLAGAAAVTLRRRDAAPGPVQVLVAVVVATAVTIAGLLLWPGDTDMFGRIHAMYLGIVVGLPTVGVLVGVTACRRRAGAATLALCGLLVLPAPLGWYMTHIEPHWLRVDHLDVPVDPQRTGNGSVRVAVLADLQTAEVGDHERAAVQAVLDADADLILLPGDLFQVRGDVPRERSAELRALLATLHAPFGVYFVQGDVDGPHMAAEVIEGTDIELLDDRVVELTVRDRTVLLGGISLDVDTPEAAAVRDRLLAEPPRGAITIAMSHRPDDVLHLPPDSRVDLSVAGHTHGGQVVVPGVGPIMTLTEVPRHVARGGLHRLDGNLIYLSPGVGVERAEAPQLRLFNRPAVAVLDIGA
jgi:predicted MPP superfamily phosphohydrolase